VGWLSCPRGRGRRAAGRSAPPGSSGSRNPPARR
jgi:hypothetical protein